MLLVCALQPENILLTAFMRAKLTDFGISREKGKDGIMMSLVGTPLFCAPEVTAGEGGLLLRIEWNLAPSRKSSLRRRAG